MRKNKTLKLRMNDNKIWLSIIILYTLLFAIRRISMPNTKISFMNDIYFESYDNMSSQKETIIYKYDVKTDSVDEIGKVMGYFHNCKIDKEKTVIIGVRSSFFARSDISDPDANLQFGLVQYSLENNTSKLLLSETQIRKLNSGRIIWDYSFPYDNGQKVCICFLNNEYVFVLYDLGTGSMKKIHLPIIAKVYDIKDNKIWYSSKGKIIIYDLQTEEKEQLINDRNQCSISDDNEKIVLLGNISVKHIYLYDINKKTEKRILNARWNKTFDCHSSYSSGWDESGDYFFYIEHFNKFFNSSDVQIKVYDLRTRRSKCIYSQRNTSAASAYAFIRNMD